VLQAGSCMRRALPLALIMAVAAASACAPNGASPASQASRDRRDAAEPQEEAEDAHRLSAVRIALPLESDEEIERAWAVSDDKTLLLSRWGSDSMTYYIVTAKPVAGAANRPELRHISPNRIEFLCRGEGDIPFESFPYVTVYDIEADDWTRRDVWRDPRDALRFGGLPVQGHELTNVWIEDGAVSLRFRTIPEAMPSLGGPITRIPQTLAEWDAEEKALVLHLQGTRLAEGVSAQAGAIEPEGFVTGCSVEAGSKGESVVHVVLTECALYNAAYTFGEPRTMTVRFRPMRNEEP